MWFVYAFLAALFAGLTSVLAKIGIKNINSNLATAIRTCFVLILAWSMVFITGAQKDISSINKNNMIFLALSGIATGLSWLCYYKAIQIGDVTKVVAVDKFSVVITFILAFIFLKEPFNLKTLLGMGLITGGTLVMVFLK